MIMNQGQATPMRAPSIDVNVVYLLDFLKDEFKDYPDLRVNAVAPSTTQKSQDLPQDYDTEEHDVHLLKGVRVRAGGREFFFSASWVSNNQFNLVHDLIREIRAFTNY